MASSRCPSDSAHTPCLLTPHPAHTHVQSSENKAFVVDAEALGKALHIMLSIILSPKYWQIHLPILIPLSTTQVQAAISWMDFHDSLRSQSLQSVFY